MKLNVELYGGALLAPWFDRPLSVAGRLIVKEDEQICEKLVTVDKDMLMIPNLAIHMNREANSGYKYNVQKDMLPLYGLESAKGSFFKTVAEAAGVKEEDILGHDLFLYNRMPGTVWGSEEEFVSAPRLDDLQCAFSSMEGLIAGKNEKSICVHMVMDNEAVRILLAEKNPLFESLVGKICDYPELSVMLKTLLFTGRNIAYNPDETSIDMAQMFGFIKNQNGNVVIANRIFETRLYNYYLTEAKMQQTEIYKAALQDKSQFIVNGYLDMERILERFVVHFHDIYGESDEKFLEEQGRKFFLLYLKPIINGTGNYYIESRTRDLRRTDVIVDYHGRQYIIELKIWHGDEYNKRGEQQLVGYLEDYHVDKGYMLSFNFNRKKQSGIRKIIVNGKTIVEAVV